MLVYGVAHTLHYKVIECRLFNAVSYVTETLVNIKKIPGRSVKKAHNHLIMVLSRTHNLGNIVIDLGSRHYGPKKGRRLKAFLAGYIDDGLAVYIFFFVQPVGVSSVGLKLGVGNDSVSVRKLTRHD